MRKVGRWVDRQTKERPFFSALFVLILIVVPGYARLESTVQTADDAATSASEAAISAAATAKQLTVIVKAEEERDKRILFANCQTRNTAAKNGRDRFNTFFTAIEVLITSNPEQTPEQNAQAKVFVDNLRKAVPLDAALEDVDCDEDGNLDPEDYGT